MRIKTMAVQITEETYPIAVACLPHGFSNIPFQNVKGAWLIINVPGGLDRNAYEGDTFSSVAISNQWLTQNDFESEYEIINRKPGAPGKNAWFEVEKGLDTELDEQLSGKLDEKYEDVKSSIPRQYRARLRRPVPGYGKS